MSTLAVGGRDISVDDARNVVTSYLNGSRGRYAYPSYDGYRTNDDPNHLCDGDLLAPGLLNVPVGIRSFADLSGARLQLETALQAIPQSMELSSASDDELVLIGDLYTLLDSSERPFRVQGTTLAKILHRKKPRAIPLYDTNVRSVYVSKDGPVSISKHRKWMEFMTLMATAMRDDLARSVDTWDELRALAPDGGPSVSRARVLDIVAWHVGTQPRRRRARA